MSARSIGRFVVVVALLLASLSTLKLYRSSQTLTAADFVQLLIAAIYLLLLAATLTQIAELRDAASKATKDAAEASRLAQEVLEAQRRLASAARESVDLAAVGAARQAEADRSERAANIARFRRDLEACLAEIDRLKPEFTEFARDSQSPTQWSATLFECDRRLAAWCAGTPVLPDKLAAVVLPLRELLSKVKVNLDRSPCDHGDLELGTECPECADLRSRVLHVRELVRKTCDQARALGPRLSQ